MTTKTSIMVEKYISDKLQNMKRNLKLKRAEDVIILGISEIEKNMESGKYE